MHPFVAVLNIALIAKRDRAVEGHNRTCWPSKRMPTPVPEIPKLSS
jgi:hypothetical protein